MPANLATVNVIQAEPKVQLFLYSFVNIPLKCIFDMYIRRKQGRMLMDKWISPLKIFSHVVVLLMLVAICYAAFISIKYWSGINV